jgi:hypothetical protein
MAGWVYPDKLDSQYWSYFDLPDGRRSYTLTGVAVCTVHADADEGRFYRKDLYVIVDIPGLAASHAGSQFVPEHWAPFFCLNAISNDNAAINAAWAVDSWEVTQPGGTSVEKPLRSVGYTVHLAVGDADGYILRVGYNISLVGRVV